jgi:hypothetical protein
VPPALPDNAPADCYGEAKILCGTEVETVKILLRIREVGRKDLAEIQLADVED